MIVKTAITHKYFVNGIEATAEQMEVIKEFKQKSNSSKGQGLDNEVIVRVVKTDNIISIKKGGLELELREQM
jgi:hypothetical protein